MRLFNNILFIVLLVLGVSCSKNKVIVTADKMGHETFYLDGEIEPFSGICIVPFESNENVKEIRRYKNGIIEGEALSYFSDGNLKRKGLYVKGKMSGVWEQWFENGKKEFEATYKNDSMTGQFKEWYANGNVKEEGEYKLNHRIGTWKYYDERGVLLGEKNYNQLASSIFLN